MRVRNMVFTAVFAAVLCVVSPFVIPIGPIPLSLATLVIYIAASTIDWKHGTLAVVVYIAIGLIGIPVFSGMTGGIQKLVGPTGGFIIGYIPCTLVIGLLVDRWGKKLFVYPLAMLLGTVLLYICGVVWFVFLTNSTLAAALTVCVLPFFIGDAIKIILATIVAPALRKTLKKQNI